MLRPSRLVETEDSTCFVECFSDQIAAFWWDVIISFPEDLDPRSLVMRCKCEEERWEKLEAPFLVTYHNSLTLDPPLACE